MKGSDEELLRAAQESEDSIAGEFVRRLRTVTDFRYDEVQEKYWDTTTGTLLGAKSVNGAIPKDDWPTYTDDKGKVKRQQPAQAINDVETGLTVEGSTWWPGKGKFLYDTIVNDRGVIDKAGAVTYNSYVAPTHRQPPEGVKPDQWIQHVKKIYPDPVEQEHFFDFAAHMLQRPDQKVNHGIVMAGNFGIGKDTALLPLRAGVGMWNAAEIEPDAISRHYNPYIKSVMLIINEVRPHDEDHKASNFYNQIKPLLAAPPDMLPMEVKYANTVYVPNLCHVLLTTNDPLTMYIPEDDRRLFVMTSNAPSARDKQAFEAFFGSRYFQHMYKYLYEGGMEAAIQWLLDRDVSDFDAGQHPPMTAGKKAIIESATQIRRSVIDDLVEQYIETECDEERPAVIFHRDLSEYVARGPWFDDAKSVTKMLNAKNFHFKMDEHGYEMMRNPYSAEWRHKKFRSRMAFVRKDITSGERYDAVNDALQCRPLIFSFELKE